MNYAARRAPLAPVLSWRLEDGVLIEDGRRQRRLPLSELTLARIGPGAHPRGERVLALNFRRRRVAIVSHSWAGGGWADQRPEFAAFAKAVLAEAAHAAPNARYRLAGGRTAGVYGGVLAILALGLVLILVATLAAGQMTLGFDLAARLAFALILALIPLPWLQDFGKRSFDPQDVPEGVL